MPTLFKCYISGVLLSIWGTAVFAAQTGSVASSQPNAAPTQPISYECVMTAGPLISGVSGPTRPYSAVEEVVHTQTLSDGTQLTEKHLTAKLYRDSQGRERRENPFCRPDESLEGLMVAEIHDPVAGYAYVLDPEGHVAHRFVSAPIRRPAPMAQKETGKVVVDFAPRAIGTKGVMTEPLGSQMIEGVYAEGTRTTTTIPAGREGNDRPISIVQESWVSHELEISILNKYVDPRNGETITRLTNLDLSEPSVDLFQVPPDYKIVDETESVTIRYHSQ